uniref:Uncharacterized protein n=1 Tax=Arundo donax TaxID=35708 RepID=A0A0A9AUV3_ARUDO
MAPWHMLRRLNLLVQLNKLNNKISITITFRYSDCTTCKKLELPGAPPP